MYIPRCHYNNLFLEISCPFSPVTRKKQTECVKLAQKWKDLFPGVLRTTKLPLWKDGNLGLIVNQSLAQSCYAVFFLLTEPSQPAST